MDIANLIIGIVILAFFIVPVLLLSRSGKNKRNKLLKDLEAEASNNGIILTESDVWNESALGFDSSSGTVIFVDESKSEKEISIFNLADVKSFRTIPPVNSKESDIADLKKENRLALEFSFKKPGKSNIVINFYISGFGKMTEHEQKLFRKWSALFRDAI
ncbi:MAG: hypothetical protein KA114_08810 [Bacteroidales bacterium]|nr:hypothetical protein [Bacteroidales bacterium]